MAGVSSPNDLDDVDITNSKESEFNLTEFMNSPMEGLSFQVPEIEASTDPMLDSVLLEFDKISEDQEINTQMNPLPSNIAGTTAEDNELCLDRLLNSDMFNLDEIPDIETFNSFSPDFHEGAPSIDNSNHLHTSGVEPQNHVSMDSEILPPLTDGYSNNQAVAWTSGNCPQVLQGQTMAAGSQQDFSASHYRNSDHQSAALTSDVPMDYNASVQNQPYPESGNCSQGLQGQTIAAGLQQDFSASCYRNSDDQAAALTSDVPMDHPASVQNQPCPEIGNCPRDPQGQTTTTRLQQDSSSPYDLNSHLFGMNMMNWLVTQPHPQCTSCKLMRRIVHSNGFHDTKLEVHCHETVNFHAVLQVRLCNIGNAGHQSNSLPQLTQFPRGNPDYMKHFLMQYSLLRAKEGFWLRHDCVLVNIEKGTGMSLISDPYFPEPNNSFSQQTDLNNAQPFGNPSLIPWNATNNAPPPKRHKSYVAAQRERTGRLQLKDCAKYFHLPINDAAKKIAISATVLKKICRRNGLGRWPYRKIKSIERTIASLERSITDGNGQEAEIIKQIEMLKQQLIQIRGGYVTQSN